MMDDGWMMNAVERDISSDLIRLSIIQSPYLRMHHIPYSVSTIPQLINNKMISFSFPRPLIIIRTILRTYIVHST